MPGRGEAAAQRAAAGTAHLKTASLLLIFVYRMIKLFIVGFPKDMDEPALQAFFSDFGDVKAVKLITDQQTGMNKGYGFVDFMDEAGARLAIKELDGTELQGRTLGVRLADQQARPRKPVELPVQERTYTRVRNNSGKRPRRQG